MEKGEASKQQKICITSSPSSAAGSVTREADAADSISITEDGLIPQPTFIRGSDQYVPLANLTRIMRSILPPHAKIADDAKETIQECVSEFISFVTSKANARCRHIEQRKTVYAEDVLSAMETLGFQNYKEYLTLYLKQHRICGLNERHATMPLSRGDMILAQPSTLQLLPQPPNSMENAPTIFAPSQPALPNMNEIGADGAGEGKP